LALGDSAAVPALAPVDAARAEDADSVMPAMDSDDELIDTFCNVCGQGEDGSDVNPIILCDRVEPTPCMNGRLAVSYVLLSFFLLCAEYHLHCLIPELLSVPEGVWMCPDCR
jgi:hypothetical protein